MPRNESILRGRETTVLNTLMNLPWQPKGRTSLRTKEEVPSEWTFTSGTQKDWGSQRSIFVRRPWRGTKWGWKERLSRPMMDAWRKVINCGNWRPMKRWNETNMMNVRSNYLFWAVKLGVCEQQRHSGTHQRVLSPFSRRKHSLSQTRVKGQIFLFVQKMLLLGENLERSILKLY